MNALNPDCHIYHGSHRDVNWEIRHHSFDSSVQRGGIWNTYLIFFGELAEKYWSEEVREYEAPVSKRKWTVVEAHPSLRGLEGWNGDITFCEQHLDQMGRKTVKVGDDFIHLWDLERADLYSASYMKRHIEKIIDELLDGSRPKESWESQD